MILLIVYNRIIIVKDLSNGCSLHVIRNNDILVFILYYNFVFSSIYKSIAASKSERFFR